ncbi:hypothetical protein [Nostoc sp.]|uniref:hypothetical protein n=1 Tax=Nostoc sp. TaxID=1180 RepID=UPI002FF94797
MDFRKFYIPTVMAGLALLTSANEAQAQTTSDLTGTWSCGGSTVGNVIRQVGSQIWEVTDSPVSTTTFYGNVLNGFINATWADLPKTGYLNYGYISGKVVSPNRITVTYTFASPSLIGQTASNTCTRR